MRERISFLIDPQDAPEVGCPPDIGRPAGFWRIVTASPGDKTFELLRRCEEKWISEDRPAHFARGWKCRRLYTPTELEAAELFQFVARDVDSEAESDPSAYDVACACPHCGAGRRQITDLAIDLSRLPKSRPIVRTIGNEWLLRKDLAEALAREEFTGFRLRPVTHRRNRFNMPSVFKRSPIGRRILERAWAEGRLPKVGLESEYADLWPQLLAEYRQAVGRAGDRAPRLRRSTEWLQLEITSKPVPLCPKTEFGINYFDRDQPGRYRCPLGHTGGLFLLSEVWIRRGDWDGADMVTTVTLYGHSRSTSGPPQPAILISPRLYRFLSARRVKGVVFEVAHLV